MMKFVLAAAAALLLTGCATVFSGDNDQVTFNSTPEGAQVTIEDQYGNVVDSGTTPLTVNLRPDAGFFSPARYTVKISQPGYDEQVIPLDATVDPVTFVNIIWLLGFVVDGATGEFWKFDRPVVNANLRQNRAENDDERQLIVSVRMLEDLTEEERQYLVPLND